MIPLVLVAAGLAALVTGWAVLRSLGPGARVGRILAATRIVPVADACALAEAGAGRYVGVRGRIDAEGEFEDEHHRPLVFRRTRLEAAHGREWRVLDERREVIPFEVAVGLDRIAVDGDALAEGLVVVIRESVGTAGEIPDRVPADLPPDTRVRLRIEHVSSVEQAIVLGVPGLDADRRPVIRAGAGRPLVLTTLEPPEAMRLLALGQRRKTVVATGLLAGGLAVLTLGVLAGVLDALL